MRKCLLNTLTKIFKNLTFLLHEFLSNKFGLEMIDRLHGSRVWTSIRLNEPLIKLVIDCRNLHRAAPHQINNAIGYVKS